MSQYQTLKAQVSANIKQNDNQEIRGDILQAQLLAMINSLGVGYQYMGLATPATDPGTPDQNVFFLATEAGTYTNFNSLVVNDGEVCALVWNGAWAKQVTGAATAAQVSQLGQKVTELDAKATATTVNGFFIQVADGARVGSAPNSLLVYQIDNPLYYTKVKAHLNGDATTIAAIAFYSGDYTNPANYISGVAKGWSQTDYESAIPSNCKYIVVTIASASIANATFALEKNLDLCKTVNEKTDTNAAAIAKLDEETSSQLYDKVDGKNYEGTTQTGSRFVIFSDGSISGTGSSWDIYTIIPNKRFDKIKVTVGSDTTLIAAIAFYSGETPSTANYLSEESIVMRNGVSDYETTVPESCKSIVVSNNNGVLASPTILLTEYVIKTISDIEMELDTKLYKIEKIQDAEDLGSMWINASTGALVGSTGYSLYAIEATNIQYKTIIAHISKEYQTVAAIAFYSGKPFGTGTYISGTTSSTVKEDYSAIIPDGCKYVLVRNRAAGVATPSIVGVVDAEKRGVDLNAVAKKADNNEIKIEEQSFSSALGVYPFRTVKYYDHLFIDKINGLNVVIPSESLFNIQIAKRLGFDMIEANCHLTSDGEIVVFHGNGGNFGLQFQHIDGVTDISGTSVNSVTLDWIKENVRYKSLYAKYRVSPPTLSEWLLEIKRNNMIPFVQMVTGAKELCEKIVGAGNYIAYLGGHAGTNTIISEFLSLATKEEIVERCRFRGKPFVYSMANPTDFTDNELKDIIASVHQEGCWISWAACYCSETENQRLMELGFDFAASGWSINEFETGNLCNLFGDLEFSDFSTNGQITDESIVLSEGETVTKANNIPSVFLGGAILKVRFVGGIHLKMGEYIDNDFERAEEGELTFSTYYLNASPNFTITAKSGGATITGISFKASKM